MNKKCARCRKEFPEKDYEFKLNGKDRHSCCKKCVEYKNNILNPNRNNAPMRNYPSPLKAIYGIIDENKKIVYIGESKNTPFRLYRHFNSGKGNTTLHEYRNDKWSYVILWDGTDYNKQDRLLREAVLIQTLRPKYNKQWQQDDDINLNAIKNKDKFADE